MSSIHSPLAFREPKPERGNVKRIMQELSEGKKGKKQTEEKEKEEEAKDANTSEAA